MKNQKSATMMVKKTIAPTDAAMMAVLEKGWVLEVVSKVVSEEVDVEVGDAAPFVGAVPVAWALT
jgi:hypothetical protein